MKTPIHRVFVTGGAGFIGSHSVDLLLAGGAAVVVYDNFSSGRRSNLAEHPKLTVVEGDIRDAESVRAAMAGASHVLHLAAQVSVKASVEDPVNSTHNNILGFVAVLDAAVRNHVKRVVYASSAAVYGIPLHDPLNETSPARPLSPYGLEKLVNDQYAALFSQLYGLSSLGMRYFNVYGPRQLADSPYAGVISRFVDRLKMGQPLRVFGDGGQTRDFIHVADIAHINRLALDSDTSGVCNVGTGQSVTVLKLIDILGKVAGRTPEIAFEPAVPGDIYHSSMSPHRLRTLFDTQEVISLEQGLPSLLD